MKVFEHKWASAIAGAVLGVALAGSQAVAQSPDQATAKPEQKQFDDWQVRCSTAPSPNPCDMFQELANPQQRNQRVMAILIAYVPSMDRYELRVAVPLGVSIPKGLTLQTDTYTSPVLRYRNCDRDGCYVDVGVDKSLIEGLANSSPAGKAKVNITGDNAAKSVGIPFYLKGFAAAHDDMVSEAKAKAKPVSQGNAPAPAAPAH